MATGRKLGIWMDHASAHIIEFTVNPTETKTLESEFTSDRKADTLGRSENVMHNKEQHEQATFYKKLGSVIANYDEVLLFGPTTAKNELANMLEADHHFERIKIETKDCDKMSANEQLLFVKHHFTVGVNNNHTPGHTGL